MKRGVSTNKLLWLDFADRCHTNVYYGVLENNVWSICEMCVYIIRHLEFPMHSPVFINIWKRTRRLLIGPLIPDTSRVGSAPNAHIHTLVTLFNPFNRWIHVQF